MNESLFENPYLKNDIEKSPMKMNQEMFNDSHNSHFESMGDGNDWNLKSIAKVDPMAKEKMMKLEKEGWTLVEGLVSEKSNFWVYEKITDIGMNQVVP